jgi:hypothetical protein
MKILFFNLFLPEKEIIGLDRMPVVSLEIIHLHMMFVVDHFIYRAKITRVKNIKKFTIQSI